MPTEQTGPADPAGAGPGAKQVFFHVGAPKTGTTFLQQVMWHNRHRLRENGVCYPVDSPTAHFIATLDLCERSWGGRIDPSWAGSWERVADRVRRSPGDRAIFSSEIMGLATPEQAKRAIESVQPAEVHVVFTARDLARQLPSDWQEQVKHRHTVTLTKFVDDLVTLGIDAPRPFGEMFWGLHDPIHVLAKWEGLVPRENIHVVTVGQASAAPDLLWRRFASVVRIEPSDFSVDVPRDNTAMGVVEAEFLRRFNTTARKRLTREHGQVLNKLVGQRLLAARADKQTIRLPRQYSDWADARSEQLISELRSSGYAIVGDLADLRPVHLTPDETAVWPEDVTDRAVDEVAFDVVAGLIEEVAALRSRLREYRSGSGEPATRSPLDKRAGKKAAKKAAAKKAAAERSAQRGSGADAGADPGSQDSWRASGRRPGEPAISLRPQQRPGTNDEGPYPNDDLDFD